MAERALQWEEVPKGTSPSRCKSAACGKEIYWIERPSRQRGKAHMTVRVPVDCDVDGGSSPDSLSDGRGANHYQTCVAAREF